MKKDQITLDGKAYDRTISANGGAIYRVRRQGPDGLFKSWSCLNPHTHRALIRRIESALQRSSH